MGNRKKVDKRRCRIEEAVGSKQARTMCTRNGFRQAIGVVRGPVGGHVSRTKDAGWVGTNIRDICWDRPKR